MRLDKLLSNGASRFGHKTAIVAGSNRHSYAELDRKSGRLAGALNERGLKPGDRVVVQMDNGFEAVVAIFAALKAGAVIVPADPASDADRLALVIDHSQAVAIVTQARLASMAASALSKTAAIRLVVLTGGDRASYGQSCVCFEEVVNRLGPAPAPAAGRDADDVAVLFYRSGAAGMVEPVAMTHGEIAAALAAAVHAPAGHDGAIALEAPAIVSAESLCRLMAAIAAGASLVVERRLAGTRVTRAGQDGHRRVGANVPPPAGVASWDGQRRPVRRHHTDGKGTRPPG